MRAELPVLSGLMEQGCVGNLESCDPPITVPAWSCMMSSKDPGTLGFYGFRNRADHCYDGMTFATSERMKHDRLWDILGRAGKHCVVIGVPMTFPPPQVNGEMIGVLPGAVDRVALHVPGRAPRRDHRGRRRVHVRRPQLPHRREGAHLRRHRRDDPAPVHAGAPSPRHPPVGVPDDGRDGHRPPAPRLLAVLRPQASRLRARHEVRAGLPRLLQDGRRRDRRADRGPRRRHRRDGRLRPRRPVDVRRHPDQRVADAERLPAPGRSAPEPTPIGKTRSTGDAPRCGRTAATTRGSS